MSSSHPQHCNRFLFGVSPHRGFWPTRKAAVAVCFGLAVAGAWALGADRPTMNRPDHVGVQSSALAQNPEDDFWDLLRLLMRLFGLDPESLPTAPPFEPAMVVVIDTYWTNGLPTLGSDDEYVAGRSLVRDTYAMAQKLESSLDPVVYANFLTMLRALYEDLGGDPGDLGG
jgi:hypothetical protein